MKVIYISENRLSSYSLDLPFSYLGSNRSEYSWLDPGSIINFVNNHGVRFLDISEAAAQLIAWPFCKVFLDVFGSSYFLCSGLAQFDHHGEPSGYRFS